MKKYLLHLKTALFGIAFSGAFVCLSTQVIAAEWDYRWSGGGSQTYWERSNGWLDSTGAATTSYPNGAGIYVYFSRENPLGAQQYITLSGQVSLGRLDIGNVSDAGARFTLRNGQATSGTEGFLYFTGWNGGNAQINELAGISQGDNIETAVKIAADLDISNASNFTLSLSQTLSSATAGLKTVTLKSGKLYVGYAEDGLGKLSVINNGGDMTIGSAAYSGDTSVTNGGTLTISTTGYAGNSFVGATSTLSYIGALEGFTGNVNIEATGNLALVSSLTGSFNSQITGAGNLIKAGGGHTSLEANNTYTGDTILRAGALKIASDSNLGNGGKFVFENSGWGQLEFIANTTLNRDIELTGSGAALIGLTEGLTATLAGNITGNGTGGIQKRFAGTLVLDGTGSFSSSVTVGAGTLIINGDYRDANGYMIVVSTASIGGSGIYGGRMQINGTARPDGILTVNTASLSSLSSLVVGIGKSSGAATADRLKVIDSITLGNISKFDGPNLQLSFGAGAENITVGDIFFIIENESANSIIGQFYQLNGIETAMGEGDTITYNGINFKITYQADFDSNAFTGGNDMALQALSIPEPATAAALLAACAMVLVCSRRRRT